MITADVWVGVINTSNEDTIVDATITILSDTLLPQAIALIYKRIYG
jgi:hypothetical protein